MNDIEKVNKNQSLGSFDVLSIVASFILVLGISLVAYKNHLESKKSSQAKNYAEKLAQELILNPVKSAQESSSRMPASDVSSLDPWGSIFKTHIIRNSYGQPIYLLVLSAGPNHKFDTQLPDVLKFADSQIENLNLRGDDIGSIKSFR